MLEGFQGLLRKFFINGVINGGPTSIPTETAEGSQSTYNCNVWCFSEGSSDAVSESTTSSSGDCAATKCNQSGSIREFVSMNKSYLSTIAEESHSYWVDDYGDLSVCTSTRRGIRNAGFHNVPLPQTSSNSAPRLMEGQFGTACGSMSFETTSSCSSEESMNAASTSDQGILPSVGCNTAAATHGKTPQHMVVEFPGGNEATFVSEEEQAVIQHHPATINLSEAQAQMYEQWIRDDKKTKLDRVTSIWHQESEYTSAVSVESNLGKNTTPDVVNNNTCRQEDVYTSAVFVESNSDINTTASDVATNLTCHQEVVFSSAVFVESNSDRSTTPDVLNNINSHQADVHSSAELLKSKSERKTTQDVRSNINCHQENEYSSTVFVESKPDRKTTPEVLNNINFHQEDVYSSTVFVESKSANSDENTNSFWPTNYLSAIVAPSFEDGRADDFITFSRLSLDDSDAGGDALIRPSNTTDNISNRILEEPLESNPISLSNRILQKNAIYRRSLNSTFSMISVHSSESSLHDILQSSAKAKNIEQPFHVDKNLVLERGMLQNNDSLHTASAKIVITLSNAETDFHVESASNAVSELRLHQNVLSGEPDTNPAPPLAIVKCHGGSDYISRSELAMLQSAESTNTAFTTTNIILPHMDTESCRGPLCELDTIDAKNDEITSTLTPAIYSSASALEEDTIVEHRQPHDGYVLRGEGKEILPGVMFSSINKFNQLLEDRESPELTVFHGRGQYVQRNAAHRRSLNNTGPMMSENLKTPYYHIHQLPTQAKIVKVPSDETGHNSVSEPELPQNVDFLSKALAKADASLPHMNAAFNVGGESNLDSALTPLQIVQGINTAASSLTPPHVNLECHGGAELISRHEQVLPRNADCSIGAVVTAYKDLPEINADGCGRNKFKSEIQFSLNSPYHDQAVSNFWPINYLSAPALSLDGWVEGDVRLEYRQPIDGVLIRSEDKEFLSCSHFSVDNKIYHSVPKQEFPELTPCDYSDRIMQRNAIYRRSLKHISSIVGCKSDAVHNGCSQVE